MNAKAKELGMKNTTFVNSSGLDNTDSGNYSTAYDMALVTSYAMKNKDYRQIVGTKKHTVKTNYKTYIWYNKNKLLQYEYITGGKTGYTEKAKRTLVSTANIDKMNLVVVTLKDSDDWNTHLELYEYADNNYISYKVLDKNNFSYKNDLYKDIYIKEDVYIPLTKEEIDNVTSNIKLYKLKKYDKNTIVGKNEILVNDKLITSINIYAKPEKKIEEKSFIKRIMDFFK